MTIQAEGMKTRLGTDLEVRPRAAMTVYARVEAATVGIIMMTREAIDRDVLGVIEIERHGRCARQIRLARGNAGRGRQH